MHLRRVDDPPGDLVATIEARLLADLRATVPQSLNSRFAFLREDAAGEIVAGLMASTGYGWLHVEMLWVSPALRLGGVGRALMAAAEAEGRVRGCRGAWLDTSNGSAAAFYRRLGYEPFGVLASAPGDPVPTHRRWFLSRRLPPEAGAPGG
ncbi:GNAT family N-acetyltransferase [Prosthecomicrobium sp. N25]|uniref:GNAT family N-acetyltransferase n=1 Tax=Prosthecomicrobium sp. N25 TaxID=3129254 RepID=UPI0030768AD5